MYLESYTLLMGHMLQSEQGQECAGKFSTTGTILYIFLSRVSVYAFTHTIPSSLLLLLCKPPLN